MRAHNRSKLIRDLNDTALGLIEEAEIAYPDRAYVLVELAGALDELRVSLQQDTNYPTAAAHYINVVPANCA